MTTPKTILSVGEAMIELSAGSSDGWKQGFAGDTLNTAWYLRALLGSEWNVAYYTGLGHDRMSREMNAFIEKAGIEPRIREIADRRPGLYMIHQENGDRQFTYWRDQSAAKLLAEDETVLTATLSDADAIYFSGITMAILQPDHRQTFLEAVAKRRAAGAMVCFDPNIRPVLWKDADEMRRWLTEAAAHASIVLPTFEDEAKLFGDADLEATAARYRSGGSDEVVVKDGKNPALIVTERLSHWVPAPSDVKVVDATGAGDSFNGGYLAARLTGREPEAAVAHGHQVAAIGLGYHGALVVPEKFAALKV